MVYQPLTTGEPPLVLRVVIGGRLTSGHQVGWVGRFPPVAAQIAWNWLTSRCIFAVAGASATPGTVDGRWGGLVRICSWLRVLTTGGCGGLSVLSRFV